MVDQPSVKQQRSRARGTMTILSGATDSDEFISGGRSAVLIHVPTITSAALTFKVRVSADDDLTLLTDMSGTTVTIPTSTGAFTRMVPLLSGYYSFQIIADNAQGSDRTFYVTAVGDNATPVISDIEATIVSGSTLTANQGTQGSTASPWFVEPVGTASSGPLNPNAAVMADNIALPTTTEVGAVNQVYDGTNLDLMRSAVGAAATGVGVAGVALIPTNLAVTTPLVIASTAAEASHVIKGSAGTLYGFVAESTVTQFIQIYDSTTLPADAVVPFLTVAITANVPVAVQFGDLGIRCATGIVIGNSTTYLTKTIGAANTLFNVQYE